MEIFIGLAIVSFFILLSIWIKHCSRKQKDKYIKNRGKLGESIVSNILLKYGGRILNDYMILDEYNKSHQIDHIFINQRGVFIIETKTYSGLIYGDQNQKYWTQVLAYGNVKNQFYNPIKQNATHYYQIKNLIARFNYIPVYSCVVFVDGNIDKVNANNVFDIEGLIDFIDNKPEKLSNSQVENVVTFLESKEVNNISEEEHLSSIKQTLSNVNNNICPRCNGKLIMRNGKNGKFYGCSNYPRCKFTKQINNLDIFDK